MAAAKVEVAITLLIDMIETKFQMFLSGFRGRPTHWKCYHRSNMAADAIFQYGDRQSGCIDYYQFI